jgi:hypothetical protein
VILCKTLLPSANIILVVIPFPKPIFDLAVETLFAPVPPLEIAITPVTLDAVATVPTTLAAVKFVNEPPLFEARLVKLADAG